MFEILWIVKSMDEIFQKSTNFMKIFSLFCLKFRASQICSTKKMHKKFYKKILNISFLLHCEKNLTTFSNDQRNLGWSEIDESFFLLFPLNKKRFFQFHKKILLQLIFSLIFSGYNITELLVNAFIHFDHRYKSPER